MCIDIMLKKRKVRIMRKLNFVTTIAITTILIGCSGSRNTDYYSYNQKEMIDYKGYIYLFGESHGNEKILKKEFELWNDYYQNDMRHLFIELPYYTAEFINIWLKEDNDKIINELQKNWPRTADNTPLKIDFYKKIKDYCPETIFHGTDVGHQYYSTGYRFLEYLEDNNFEDSIKFKLTKEAISQGIYYSGPPKKHLYRENKMVENFIREINRINGKDIMGIYGAAHTGLEDLNFTNDIPNMANQLNSLLKGKITSTDLRPIAKDIEPIRKDEIKLNNKVYSASYYGKQDLIGFKNYQYREFWCIENAYDDFKHYKKNKDFLPSSNYPMTIELKKLYMIEYKDMEGKVTVDYYLSDGREWKRQLVTESISIPN